MSNYRAVVGIEIHVQPKTKTKMFCACPVPDVKAPPNTSVCPVCLGLPGSLPVPNEAVLDQALILGLALNCDIRPQIIFARKHYFYPDLPKGYQISQFENPVAVKGYYAVAGFRIGVTRIHLEEDTAKLVHEDKVSLIDYNRSGMPLIELVTEPDFESGEQARLWLKSIHRLITNLGISEANMESGTMRIEPNISVGTKEQLSKGRLPDYKVEVKNINSFRYVKQAIDYEIARQMRALQDRVTIPSETRGWNEKLNQTQVQRTKETSPDYRYFPEPDIPPIIITPHRLEKAKQALVRNPEVREQELIDQWEISREMAKIIIDHKALVNGLTIIEYIEQVAETGVAPAQVAKMVINKPTIRAEIDPLNFKQYLKTQKQERLQDRVLLAAVVEKILKQHTFAVKTYQEGKLAVVEFILGKVMRETNGKADPVLAKIIIMEQLAQQNND